MSFKAFEVLKIKEFTFVNDCFQNENNAVFGVFLQRLISACTKTASFAVFDKKASKTRLSRF